MISQQPLIFISHSSKDAALASVIQSQITDTTGLATERVFRSTDPVSIPPGSDWFNIINAALDSVTALVVILSPYSIQSMWVGYEIGYFWNRSGGQGKIYPLLVPQTRIDGPIQRLNYIPLGDIEKVQTFFKHLCVTLGISNTGLTNPSLVVNAAIAAIDAFEKRKLQEYLDYEVKYSEEINYRKLDRELDLSPGTSERLLPGLIPPNWQIDESLRRSAGTALYPPPTPFNPPGDPF